MGAAFKRFVASGKGGFFTLNFRHGQLREARSSRPVCLLAARRTNARIKGLSDARMRDPHPQRASLATKRSHHGRDLPSCTNYQVDDSTKSGDFVNCRYYQKLSEKPLKSKNKQSLQETLISIPYVAPQLCCDHFHALQEALKVFCAIKFYVCPSIFCKRNKSLGDLVWTALFNDINLLFSFQGLHLQLRDP